MDRPILHEIHVPPEEVLERLQQPEIRVGMPRRGEGEELHQEIEIARRRVELPVSSGNDLVTL